MSKEIRPLIGISCGKTGMAYGTHRHNLGDTYIQAVIGAGGAPLIIPAIEDESSLYSLYRSLDGLILSGGVDMHPRYFGEEMDGTEDVDEARDYAETTITGWALEENMPIFGICRGHQVLNVALGGSLYQDIPSAMPSALDHQTSSKAKQRALLAHPVAIDPSSKLAAIVGKTELNVNTLHHQSVKAVGKGLKVTGTAPDGVIEALESEQHDWVLSVQWHPEDLYAGHDWSRRLFAAFISEVRQRD